MSSGGNTQDRNDEKEGYIGMERKDMCYLSICCPESDNCRLISLFILHVILY